MIKLRFVLAWLVVAMLAACGGGGGEAPGPEAPVPPPVANPAVVAGVFESSGISTSTETTLETLAGAIHVHSDGAVVGRLWRSFHGRPRYTAGTEELLTFSGSLSTGAITYTYALRRGTQQTDDHIAWVDSTQEGAGTLSVSLATSNGAPALSVTLPAASIPFGVRAVTLPKKQLPGVYIGLPLEKLGGWMQFSIQRDPDMASRSSATPAPLEALHAAVVHHDAATGVVSGSFGPQCQIAGKLYGYDAATGTVRQDWTLSGSGCPVAGTSQMVGQLLDGPILGTQVAGVIGGRWTVATLAHPLPAMPGPYGTIAGQYGSRNQEQTGSLVVHPDGTVLATGVRYGGAALEDSDTGVFQGRLEGSGPPYRATGEFVVQRERWDPAASDSVSSGTATLEITPTTDGAYPAALVRISSALTPPLAEFVAIRSSAWHLGQPFERLTGLYSRGAVATPGAPACLSPICMDGMPMQVQLDATGNFSGTVFDNCQLTGRIYAYDQPFGLFRQEVAFQGSGCPVTGTAQLLGRVGAGGRSAPYIALYSSGIIAGRPLSVVLVHSTNLP
jgi:hypothetical protein